MTAIRRSLTQLDPSWLLLGGGFVGVAMVLAGLEEDGPVLCPSRALTGAYCPGCGMTRATGRIVRGDWSGAWRLHPLVFLVLAQLGLLLMAIAHGGGWWDRLGRYLPAVLFGNLALFAGVWVVRLALGQIPTPF